MLNRRRTLGFLGGSMLATVSGTGLLASPTRSKKLMLDPKNPEHLHYMHRKLAFSLDDRLTYWNIEALRMGFRNGIITPFWKLHVGIIHKNTSLDQFCYRNQVILKVYYSDLENNSLLEEFDNPYTGKIVKAVQPQLFKTERIYGLRGVIRPDKTGNGRIYRNDEIGPARIVGNDLWLNADSIMRSEPPNRDNRLVQVNDWSTYHGSMIEITDPDISSASATHTFNDLNTFNHSWIGMADVPNIWSISRGFGRKSHSPDGLPSIWKRFAVQTHPELLTSNPGFE